MNADKTLWAVLPDGTGLSYSMAGPEGGRPVLLLHAWGESRRSFDRLLPLLPASVRVAAVDQRGHGQSDKPSTGYSLGAMAADVVGFIDAIGFESAVMVGSSSGGYVAQQVAVAAPDRVAALVLVGSPLSLRGRPDFAREVESLGDPVDPAWVRKSLAWFPRSTPVPRWYLEDRIRDGANIPAHVWGGTLDGLCGAMPPTEAGSIECPTLILWGEEDGVLPRTQQDGLAAAIPGSRLVVYANTGHLVLWEQPGRIAEDIAAFLQTLG